MKTPAFFCFSEVTSMEEELEKEYCADCPYPSHGFVCRGKDGECMRSRINKINDVKEEKRGNASNALQ